ncbi:MAG: beta-barrel assembly-enhancing protease [Pseudomonadota bacterium]|jgi:predicted Zn-dependent protease|nr:beta-barrel assembly-enhancing protease [Pseudomonadota bacterium]
MPETMSSTDTATQRRPRASIIRSSLRNSVLALVAIGLVIPPLPAANSDLPDIGSPGDSVLSRDLELQIGRSIYRSLVDTDRVVSDPEIQEYIQDIGQKLAIQANDGDFQFNFFVVNDSAINAFALPGGYIGIHSGLILATNSESELAGVMAHEISHVTQRHISRAVYANQRNSILSMAAMLGAILLGAAGGSSDAITGAIATAQGVAAQQQINFTRANEYEADRVGVGVLAAAGFDPEGMPSFFETLARQSGPLASQAPEFLRTHPVTVNRIAETRERADSLPRPEVRDAAGYSLTRARIRVLSASTPQKALEFFLGEQQNPKSVGNLGTDYGIALVRMQLGEYGAARDLFQSLRAAHPGTIPFHTGLANAELALGNKSQALSIYDQAMALFPRNVPLTVRYAEALLANGDAKKAHNILLDLLNNVPPTAQQVRLIALAASAAGDTAEAHYYMAELHLIKGDATMAADQLRLALSIPGLNSVQKARFTARLEQIQEWVDKEQKARRQNNGSSP